MSVVTVAPEQAEPLSFTTAMVNTMENDLLASFGCQNP